MVTGIGSAQEYLTSNSGISSDNVKNTILKSTQVVTDNIESSSAVKVVSGNASDPTVMSNTLLLLPPLLLADKFIESKLAGNETSSLLAKAGKLGDKLSNLLHLDNIISKETGSKISGFLSNNRFTKYFTQNYKAIPKSPFAQKQTLAEKFSQEIISTLKGFVTNESNAETLNKLSKETVEVLINAAEDGKSASSVPVDKLVGAVDDLIANGVTNISKKGLFTSKNINLSGLRNKLKAADMQMGKTGLGQAFSKGLLRSKELITFEGGLMGLAFTANAFIKAFKAAKEAPKGEKKATFMHVLSENYIGLLLFSPSINLLYKAGGNKYRGMSVEARNALKDLIQKTNSNGNLTKEAYKIAQMQKKLLLKGVDKDKVAELAGKSLTEAKTLFSSLKNSGAKLKFWEKPLKAAGNILTIGLDSIKKPASSKLGKITGKLKGFTGGLGRFLVILMVLQPLLQKPVTKLFHKIFGEPKTYLAKQKQAEDNSSAEQPKENPESVSSDKTNKRETNLLKIFDKKTDKQVSSQQTTPMQNAVPAQPVKPQKTEEEIPALNIFNKNKSKETGYIPSIEVDFAASNTREAELEKQADAFIAQKDKELAQYKTN
ncbi:MAG: hypothetical protein ACI37R_01855 [Candidatus Avigastranaerophilus sp.]